jgi:hypothetical protein
MLHREKHRQKTGGLWRIFRARYKKGSDQLRRNGQHLPEDAGLLATICDAKLTGRLPGKAVNTKREHQRDRIKLSSLHGSGNEGKKTVSKNR